MTILFKNKLAHLPVNQIADDVAIAFANGNIPIVTSEVASGKTLILPMECSEHVEGITYVLQPTKLLANNAAEAMWKISTEGGEDPDLIGILNSNRSGEASIINQKNRVVFCTVGYALASGIVHKEKNIIFDEAHETSIDLSLAKAIVHKRRSDGDNVNVAILSATIDIENEMDFWGDRAQHFTTEGSAFPVQHLHRPAWSLGESVRYLVQDEDRKGILVFVSGKEEIDNAIEDVVSHLANLGLERGVSYEVMGIHGGSRSEERKAASRAPLVPIKILVGTNVLENGISFSWVDSGVSSGETKVMSVKGNVHFLQVEQLPSWRIHQQEGRVRRFKPASFVLASRIPVEERPNRAVPDIIRLPLTELVMHVAKIQDIRLYELRFSKNEQPAEEALSDAITTLVDLGLIEWGDGDLLLTADGKMIEVLPLSFRAAAAFCEAYRLNIVPQMLPLITFLDVGDLRQDYRLPLSGGSIWENSDIVNQIGLIAQILHEKSVSKMPLRELADLFNLSMRKYREFTNLLSTLEQKTKCHADYSVYFKPEGVMKTDLDRFTKQVIFRAMICDRYDYDPVMRSVRLRNGGRELTQSAQISRTSVCDSLRSFNSFCVTGAVRKIAPKMGVPFMVLEMVTTFGEADLPMIIERFGVDKVDPTGRLAARTRRKNEIDFGEVFESTYRTKAPLVEKTVGTFGDILQSVLNK